MKMEIWLLVLSVFICIHTLWCGAQGVSTEPPEVVGARLLNGSRESEGTVEVYYNGEWGTVCDNLWTIQEANVLCKQLGYTGADEVVIAGHFGEAAGDIFLDMVQCETGDEANLFDCEHSDIGNTSCTHKEDVGVVCTSTGSLRLENGTSLYTGRLEFLNDTLGWGTVCDEAWDSYDVYVACYQLGFDYGGPSFISPGTGPIVLGGLECNAFEDRLDECNTDPEWTPDRCTHAQDVGIQCLPYVYMEYPPGSTDSTYGIPIVFYGRARGTFCSDNWDMNAARLFCNTRHTKVLRIGFNEAYLVVPPNVIVNTINCTGDEEQIADCPEVEWAYAGDCDLNIHPMVQCQVTNKEVVFESEHFPEYGRVDVIVNWAPRSICNRTWSQEAADVVCRELGFERGAKRSFTIGGGSGDSVFDNIHCTGSEESFDECRSEIVGTSPDCNHSHDVGVECFANDDTLIRFLSGGGTAEGVVKYRVQDRWAFMCDATWTNTEAAVACRMLGYEGGTATQVADLGPDDFTDVFQWDIECDGDEERLKDCIVIQTDNPVSCAPENIAQVSCSPDTVSETMRLVGSDQPEQGRLEYYTGDEWVSVWVDKIMETASFNIWDEFCETMGYEKQLYHYYNDDGQMPFEQDSEGARRICYSQCNTLPNGTVSNYMPLGLVCKPFEIVANHPIRLVDIETGEIDNGTGAVEIYNNGEWGNICQNVYYYPAGKVCSELGYENITYARNLYRSGNVTSRIWFDLFSTYFHDDCTKLYECNHTAWGHYMDGCIPLAVTCVPDHEPPDDGGSASSLERFALSLIIMVVIVFIDFVVIDV